MYIVFFREAEEQATVYSVNTEFGEIFIPRYKCRKGDRETQGSLPLLYDVEDFPVLELILVDCTSSTLHKLHMKKGYSIYFEPQSIKSFNFCMEKSCNHEKLHFKLQNKNEKPQLFLGRSRSFVSLILLKYIKFYVFETWKYI